MSLVNLVRVVSATTGTGTLTLGLKVSGFLNMTEAGAVDGGTYSYAIEAGYVSSVATAREIGTGVWASGANTLTRNVINSTNSDALLSLTGDEQVIITPNKDDFPEVVDADRSYYVATTGNDTTGDGSVGAPWRTITHAAIFCQTRIIIENRITVQVNVADGTYDEQPFFGARLGGGGLLHFIGNTSDPTLCIIKPASSVTFSAVFNFVFNQVLGIGGFTIDATDAAFGGNGCIYGIGCDFDVLNAMILKMASNSGWFFVQLFVDSKAGLGNITFNGSGDQASAVYLHDSSATAGVWVITGTPNWTIAGVHVEQLSNFQYNSGTITGSATGPRLSVINNSSATQADNSSTFFPGNVAYDVDTTSSLSISTTFSPPAPTIGFQGAYRVAGVPTISDVPIHRTGSLIYNTSNDTLNVYYNADGVLKSIYGSGYTIASTLPAAGIVGRRAYVTDSAVAPVFGATVTGGGSVIVPVFDNGTNWIYG